MSKDGDSYRLTDEELEEIRKLAVDNQCDMWRPEGYELPNWVERIIDACVEIAPELQEYRANSKAGR